MRLKGVKWKYMFLYYHTRLCFRFNNMNIYLTAKFPKKTIDRIVLILLHTLSVNCLI